MRTLVEIDDACIRVLDALAKEEKRPRVALIRDAIDEYLAKRRKKHERDAFGLWGRRKLDALAYQAKVRREW
jgi:predicted transcriptional regulator